DAISLATGLDSKHLETHERFLTATCQFEWGAVDFASARVEVYSKPGELPDVVPASLEEDLGRRDFTINGLTVPLTATELGEWPAVEGGWADLDAGLIRVIHGRSFVEDPTRLWRAARYCGRLGMRFEPTTARLAHEALTGGALNTVSGSRLGAELFRTTASDESLGALETAQELGLLSRIGGDALDFSVLAAAAAILGTDVPLQMLRLGALWWKEPRAAEFSRDLGLESQVTGLAAQCAMGEVLEGALAAASRPLEIRIACAGWVPEAIALAGATSGFDKARLWIHELSCISLPIDGVDLAGIGIAEGPMVGVALESALDHLLDKLQPLRGSSGGNSEGGS
ncbi:MAG: hypothetical protein NTX07_00930, partial [Solirubrobacterales bacterium]|nr:hypothetical protein [Solirubrobacterales bacterium]